MLNALCLRFNNVNGCISATNSPVICGNGNVEERISLRPRSDRSKTRHARVLRNELRSITSILIFL